MNRATRSSAASAAAEVPSPRAVPEVEHTFA